MYIMYNIYMDEEGLGGEDMEGAKVHFPLNYTQQYYILYCTVLC